MTLTKPDFALVDYKGNKSPNPAPSEYPDPLWWFWLRLQEMERKTKLGGIAAKKKGFHSSGKWNKKNYPTNYSIRDKINQSGPGWEMSSALDWTFPTAQAGDFDLIAVYTKRLWKSAHDPNDPRLDLILFEFYGQMDDDRHVEGYNEYKEEEVTSDSSHLWHLHLSFIRKYIGQYWRFWALLTVLMGWSVQHWRESLPHTDTNSPHYVPPGESPAGTPKPPTSTPSKLPFYELGTRTLKEGVSPGTDVEWVQKMIGPRMMGKADGIPGAMFTRGVKWYQEWQKLYKVGDGVITKHGATWRRLGVK